MLTNGRRRAACPLLSVSPLPANPRVWRALTTPAPHTVPVHDTCTDAPPHTQHAHTQGAKMRQMHSRLVNSGVVAPQDPRVRKGSHSALSGGESDRESSRRADTTDDEESNPSKRSRTGP